MTVGAQLVRTKKEVVRRQFERFACNSSSARTKCKCPASRVQSACDPPSKVKMAALCTPSAVLRILVSCALAWFLAPRPVPAISAMLAISTVCTNFASWDTFQAEVDGTPNYAQLAVPMCFLLNGLPLFDIVAWMHGHKSIEAMLDEERSQEVSRLFAKKKLDDAHKARARKEEERLLDERVLASIERLQRSKGAKENHLCAGLKPPNASDVMS